MADSADRSQVPPASVTARELVKVGRLIERRTRQARELTRRADVLLEEVRLLRRRFRELSAVLELAAAGGSLERTRVENLVMCSAACAWPVTAEHAELCPAAVRS